MRELHSYRPGYQIDGEDGGWCADAHRVVRNAMAIGGVLLAPSFDAAHDAVVEAESAYAYTPAGAGSVAQLCDEVATALGDALDPDGRPVGRLGELVAREAAQPLVGGDDRPDFERVFERRDDGTIGLISDRMSLFDFREQLPAVRELLRRAFAHETAVRLLDYPDDDDVT